MSIPPPGMPGTEKCPICNGLMSPYYHCDSPYHPRKLLYLNHSLRRIDDITGTLSPQRAVPYETFEVCNRCYSDNSGDSERLYNLVQLNKHRTYHMGVDLAKQGADMSAITFFDKSGNMVGRILDDPAPDPRTVGSFTHSNPHILDQLRSFRLTDEQVRFFMESLLKQVQIAPQWIQVLNFQMDPYLNHYMKSASITTEVEHPTVGMLRKLRTMVEEGENPAASIWQASASETGETTDHDGYEGLMKVLTEVAKADGEPSWSRFASRRTTENCLHAIDAAIEKARGMKTSPLGFGRYVPQRISLDTVKESDADAEASGRERMKRERQRAREELDREWEKLMESDK